MKKILLIVIALLTTVSIASCNQVEYNLTYYDLEEKITLGEIVLEEETITNVALGTYHSGVVTSENRILLWGSNSRGELGDGTMEDSLLPVDITDSFDFEENEEVKSLKLGEKFSFLLTTNGRVFSWGWNFSGRLADGTISTRTSPLEVTEYFSLAEEETIEALELGVSHGAVITSNNRILTWGYNGFGQLGNGNINNSSLPIDITDNFSLESNEGIKQVVLSFVNTMVLTTNGRVFAWGNNAYGQLGNESPYVGTVPEEITEYFSLDSGDEIEKLSIGMHHVLALSKNNQLFAWGRNDFGQLGNNATSNLGTPLNITNGLNLTDETITDIISGYHHNFVITSNDKIYVWGNNQEGQLGLGNFTNQLTPLVLANLDESYAIINTRFDQSVLISEDDNLYTWGKNNFGQLGNSLKVPSNSPQRITEVTFEMVELKVETYYEQDQISLYTPQKDEYTFLGWYRDSELENLFSLDKMPQEDLSLYAKWEENN